ncbi:Arm DNA-binding domain-containing protein [Asticcacaulis sp. W401b]|uniref:Arm DNA-binding domain-containing protein n=1 Tax=Asticcacaulis sp. W401b TaxID=3388666 RepID=UPI0039707582
MLKAKKKEFKLFDEAGLYLLIKPPGSKLWRFKYHIHATALRLRTSTTSLGSSGG